MFLKFNKNKKFKNALEIYNASDNCKVSKASNEIMLDRFYDGRIIEFPFSR